MLTLQEVFRDRVLSPVPTGGSGALGPPIPSPIVSDDDDDDGDEDDDGDDEEDDDGDDDGDGDDEEDDDDDDDDYGAKLTKHEFLQVLLAQQHL